MKNYDIVIIGSGSGLSFVSSALDKDMSCALIEDAKFGGTCLTRGCIPISQVFTHRLVKLQAGYLENWNGLGSLFKQVF